MLQLKDKDSIISKIQENYKSFNDERIKIAVSEKTDDFIKPFKVVDPVYTKAEAKDSGVIFVSGDTRDPQFWLVLRNATIKEQGYNDDFQIDDYSVAFQIDLIKEAGILGWVRLALIGIDESEEVIRELAEDALSNGFVPVYWDWCHDYWVVNEDFINRWKSLFAKTNIPITRSFQLPLWDECKTEEEFFEAMRLKIKEIKEVEECGIGGFHIDLFERVQGSEVGVLTFYDGGGCEVGFATHSRYFLDLGMRFLTSILLKSD